MADTQTNGMATTAPQATMPNGVAGPGHIDATAAAFQASIAAGTARVGAPDGTSYAVPATSASTTTIGNGNKIDQVPGIVNTTNNLANKGITNNADGTQTYANGTAVPQQDPNLPAVPTDDLSKPGISQGGYVGDVYYAPGSPLPKGADGNFVTTTPTSPTDDTILKNINDLKASSDSLTTSLIDSIHQQYASLRKQQEDTNTQQQAQVQTSLLRGGVTGGGSTAQYAQISSEGIMQAQISYGIGQIADLNAKENSAIIEAQQAGQDRDFKLMDSLNSEISKIRDDKVSAAKELNAKLIEQNQTLRDKAIASSKDNAIASLYEQGITDPAQILKTLNANGANFTSDEVASTLKNIVPAGVDDLIKTMKANGAPASVISKVLKSPSLSEAYDAAGSYGAGGTGIVGEYNFYKAQQEAAGKSSVDFNTYQNIDANRKEKAAGGGSTTAEKASVVSDTISGLEDSLAANGVIQGNGTITSTDYRRAKNEFVGKMGKYLSDPAAYFDSQMAGYVDRSNQSSTDAYKNDYGIGK